MVQTRADETVYQQRKLAQGRQAEKLQKLSALFEQLPAEYSEEAKRAAKVSYP